MPRAPRAAEGGMVYHVLNRGNDRRVVFEQDRDYQMFESVLVAGRQRSDMRILCYCLMPTHWHLVVWPRRDGNLSDFMQWVGLTHTQRWHACRRTAGRGHLYQGRYKSFPVETDEHCLVVCRYVERNALRAGLVEAAQRWRWSSLWRRLNGCDSWLTPWPVEAPSDWVQRVNQPETGAELQIVRRSLERNQPFGGRVWQARTARRLGLESTMKPKGRPRKKGT